MSSRVLAGIVVLCGFLRGNAICAQQDSNLQPLAPEATTVSVSGQNAPITEASTTASPRSPGFLIPASVFIVGQSLDLHSTFVVKSRGGIELNPVMDVSPKAQAAIKIATTTAALYLAAKLHRRHPTRAKIVLYGFSAVTFTVAAYNYRIAGRR